MFETAADLPLYMAHGEVRAQSFQHVAPLELHGRLRGFHEVSGQSSQDGPDPADLGSRRSAVSAPGDSYGLRVRESLGVHHAQPLRRPALPGGRSVRCPFCYSQSMASVIPGALFPTQFVRRDLLRPSSAIAPVQSGRTFRCALRVVRADEVHTA